MREAATDAEGVWILRLLGPLPDADEVDLFADSEVVEVGGLDRFRKGHHGTMVPRRSPMSVNNGKIKYFGRID